MKSAARLYALQALFQMEASDTDAKTVTTEFLSHRFGAETAEGVFINGHTDLFKALVVEAVKHQAKIDQMTDKALKETWPIARIDPTLRALFRAASAELMIGKTPPKVVINEFVDIAKAFFPKGREPAFVNGVLDHIAHQIVPEAFKT